MPEDDQLHLEVEHNTSHWNHERFRDAIVEAVQRHDIPYGQLPQTIDLQGGIGSISDQILDTTLNDPETPEYGTYGKVTLDGKLQVRKVFTKGKSDSVIIDRDFGVEINQTAPQYSKSEYGALALHTHGDLDLPPSPTDILSLLSPTEEGGVQTSIIVTPETRYLLIRSIRTPDLDHNDKDRFVQEYRQRLRSAMSSEAERYNSHFKRIGIPIDNSMIANHVEDVVTQRKTQLGVLEGVVKDYGIGLYLGGANNQYKRRA